MDGPAAEGVAFERIGRAGVITLDRPKALNALTHPMVKAIDAQLAAWKDDAAVERVAIRASEGRAFCAGGDIRAVYDLGKRGDPDVASFFRDEYVLNAAIKRFPKPYVALIDGICMGGGAGLSIHGSHRVATERIVFAMPEAGIGFFPDVGSTFFLSRMPGKTGLYAILTSARLSLADTEWADLVTHPVPADRLADALDRVTGADDLDAALAELTVDPGHSVLKEEQERIDRFFSGADVNEILQALDTPGVHDEDWAGRTATEIRSKSPTSLEIAFHALKRAAHHDFAECMRMEYRIVTRILKGHDFYEGVRAAIVDKDKAPRWDPPYLEAVDITTVETHFQPPAEGDLPV